MGLLVTLYLMSTNVYISLEAPLKRGFSYIETWIVGAHGTLCIAIVEYGIILAWKRYAVETVKPNSASNLHHEMVQKGIGIVSNWELRPVYKNLYEYYMVL